MNATKVNDVNQESGEPTGEMFKNLEILEDVDHPLVPDPSHQYLKRRITREYEEDGETKVKRISNDLDLLTKLTADDDFNLLLVGQTGVGKNHAIRWICHETNRPMVRVNFGEGVDYSSVVGGFVPEEDGNGFEFNYRALAQAAKNGWVFVADEINAAPPELTLPLNQVTEDADSRHLTIPETGEIITPHPEFKFVATMNPGYAGTVPMNPAFKNRFYTVEVDYPDPDAELIIVKNRTNIEEYCTEEQIEKVIDIANLIRAQSMSNEGEIDSPISPRDTVKVGKLVEMMDLRSAVEMAFLGSADPLDKDSIREIIRTEKGL